MGNLRFAAAILFVAACGSDHGSTPDAMKMIDAKMIDAKVWMDAPPPTYDFSCYGMQPGTTVDANITITGTAGELGQGGLTGLTGYPVAAYKVGANTAALNGSATSGAMGAFTLGPIVSGGTAIAYVKASDPNLGNATTAPTYRTTYLYPPNPIRANFDGLPVPLIKDSLINSGTLGMFLQQDDSANGLLFVAVHDCNTTTPTPIDGATLKVQQNGQDVGSILDIGQAIPQAAGTFFVANVPDNTGSSTTEVSASYNGMNFPVVHVTAHKKLGGNNQLGSTTVTDVPPGPIN